MPSVAQVVAWLDGLPDAAEETVGRALLWGGQLLESRIKANASGRPGPNVITGAYRRSWSHRGVAGELRVDVYTNAPQGRRLEQGFVGRDSLGRIYNQPAFPHVEPALLEVGELIEARIYDAMDEAKGA